LTLSVFLASKGFRAICVEKDAAKAGMIAAGVSPILEPGVPELLRRVVGDGLLEARTSPGDMFEEAGIVFVTVGTPAGLDGGPDLSQVKEASRELGESLSGSGGMPLIAVKSTVPPGTTWGLIRPIIETASGKRCGEGFHLCSNPEFLREGSALQDTMSPDRIVIGAKHPEAADRLRSFYEALYRPLRIPTITTSPNNAELIKLATNAFLSLKISFINLISQICEELDEGDVGVVAQGLGLDPRIGPLFLRAGLGFGGSCLPKDLRMLRHFAALLGVDASLLDAVLEINRRQRARVVERAEAMIGGLNGRRIAVLGLSFKPGTDDVRESASIELVLELLAHGAEVRVHDPMAAENAKRILGEKVFYSQTPLECLKDADLAIIATEWPEYSSISPSEVKASMRNPAIIDGRRLLDPKHFRDAGIEIHVIGES